MKIEDITPQKEKKNYYVKNNWFNYWFPLPKGYNRLLIVFACLIIVYTVHEYPEKVNTFFFTLLVEVITYVAIIWIYRGFKNMKRHNYNIAIAIAISCILFLINGYHNYIKDQRKENLEKYKAGYYDNVTVKNKNIVPNTTKNYVPPKNWTKYIIANAFSISVPPTVELRQSNDLYTKDIKKLSWHGHKINSNNVVFQQKGLSVNTPEAHQTYCRIIIDIQKGSLGEYPKFSDYEDLTIEDIHTFQELAKQNSYEYKILGQPEVRWIKIEDTYGIEVEYVRNGANNSRTHVCNYYFFNDNLFATIILSYRQDDIRKWETDFSNIIKTFKWNNKK